MGGKRAMNSADDDEAWERHMRLERELLAQRRDGKLAIAIGKALPGESPQDLEQMAREDRLKAEEGLVSLLRGEQLSYVHVTSLTPTTFWRDWRRRGSRSTGSWDACEACSKRRGAVSACRMLRAERSSKRPSVGRSHGSTSGSPQC